MLGGGNFKGSITEDKIFIWEAFPGFRGISVATCIVRILPFGESSRLSATLKIPLLYQFTKPSIPKVASVVSFAVISWLLTLLGVFIDNYQSLQQIFFPVGATSIIVLMLFFSRSIGDEQLADLSNFLERTFSRYRQAPANQPPEPIC